MSLDFRSEYPVNIAEIISAGEKSWNWNHTG